VNAVTPDGEFSIEALRCVGCCGLAPVLIVNGEVFGKVETTDLQGLVQTIRTRANNIKED
jgi:NADH-quinone oxidoreductase subunit E